MDFKDFIFRLKNYVFRTSAVKQYQEAKEHLNLTTNQLNELNWNKRKEIVRFVYENIPFYKEFYDSNHFNPSYLKEESDWVKVPILPKEIVRNNLELIKNPNVNSKYIGITSTGGSTGLPLKIYTDKRFNWEVLGWRMFQQWGVSPADNVGIIHRRVPTTFLGKIKNRAIWWPTKRAYLNAASVSEKDVHKFVNQLLAKKVVWLLGYVGGLEKVADYILENKIEIKSLKLVWSTSAPLHDNVRLKMEKAFHCKIMNQYGSNEFPNIAMQCPNSSHLHINSDYLHVDVISDNQFVFNKEGDILVTSFVNKVMPLIKYEIGDRGTLITDRCNGCMNLPLLKQVKGRTTDAIYTPSGLYIDGSYLSCMFDDYPTLFNQFQVYQKGDYSVEVRVKPYDYNNHTKKILEKIKSVLVDKTNNEIPISISIVDKINDDRGKVRYIISEIALNKIKR